MTTTTTYNETQTKQHAHDLAATIDGGTVITLHGDLGAGKTTWTKGFLSFFDIDEDTVVSPTFTLLQEYPVSKNGITRIVHIDTYRMEDPDELRDIGIEDYLADPKTVILVEWPDKIEKFLDGKHVVRVEITEDDAGGREISVR